MIDQPVNNLPVHAVYTVFQVYLKLLAIVRKLRSRNLKSALKTYRFQGLYFDMETDLLILVV